MRYGGNSGATEVAALGFCQSYRNDTFFSGVPYEIFESIVHHAPSANLSSGNYGAILSVGGTITRCPQFQLNEKVRLVPRHTGAKRVRLFGSIIRQITAEISAPRNLILARSFSIATYRGPACLEVMQ